MPRTSLLMVQRDPVGALSMLHRGPLRDAPRGARCDHPGPDAWYVPGRFVQARAGAKRAMRRYLRRFRLSLSDP